MVSMVYTKIFRLCKRWYFYCFICFIVALSSHSHSEGTNLVRMRSGTLGHSAPSLSASAVRKTIISSTLGVQVFYLPNDRNDSLIPGVSFHYLFLCVAWLPINYDASGFHPPLMLDWHLVNRYVASEISRPNRSVTWWVLLTTTTN